MTFTKPDFYIRIGSYELPRIIECERKLPRAPKSLNGARILFASDVHLGRFAGLDFARRLIDQFKSLSFDMLILGGDIAETGETLAGFFEMVAELAPPLGKFGVLGNNDAQCVKNYELDPREIFASGGVELLVNERRVISLPDGRIAIAGVDERYYGSPDASGLFPDMSGILVSHYPYLEDEGQGMTLSGHTHAGQINVLGVTPYTLNFEPDYPVRKIRGWDENGLLVSAGIGMSRLPIRLGARPEAHLINLTCT